VVKGLAMKARWQDPEVQEYAEAGHCFIDEPICRRSAVDYVSVQRDDSDRQLGEVVQAVQAEGRAGGRALLRQHGVVAGWSDAGVDMRPSTRSSLAKPWRLPRADERHLVETGKFLAWGVVPTSPVIREQSVESLVEQSNKVTQNLAAKAGSD